MGALALTAVLATTLGPATAGTTTQCSTAMIGTFDSVVVPSGGDCVLTNSTVRENVKVLPGGGLRLVNTDVLGNIQADPGHRWLGLSTTSTVGGQLEAKGTTTVPPDWTTNYICNSRIMGSVKIEESGPNAPWDIGGVTAFTTPTCGFGSEIRGDVQLFKNQQRVRIADNDPLTGPQEAPGQGGVHRNLQFQENTSTIAMSPNMITMNRGLDDVQVYKNNGGVTVTVNDVADDLQCKDNSPAAVDSGKHGRRPGRVHELGPPDS